MKRLLYLTIVILSCSPSVSFSQITILSGDMPAVGDTLITATDANPVGLTIGNKGANQTWDFSSAVADSLKTNYIQSPSSTPYAANFPTANRSGTQNFTDYVFTRLTAQKYELVGATVSVFGTPTPVPYSPTNELYRFPTQYLGKFSSNWGFQIFTQYSNLPPNVQAQIDSSLPAGVTVSQFRTTNTATFTDTIDGWGTTITPVCSYNSLRQKRLETSIFRIEAYAYFSGFPIGWQSVVNDTTTATTYNWLAKETKLPLVTVGELTGNSIGTITYSLIPPTLIADFSVSTQSACPNGSLSFTDRSQGCPDSWLWTFTGATPSSSTDENPTGIVYSTPGNYTVMLQVTRDGVTTSKSVSNYITVNTLPVANAGTDAEICSGKSASLTATGGTFYSWSSGAGTATTSVSPVTTTTYTVTVSNSFGCTAFDNVEVLVNPLPPADAGTDDTVCLGNTGSLTASGGISYSWNNGNNTATLSASPLASTAYTVTVTDVKGCSATDNAMIEVLSLPAADAGIDDNICIGETGTLTASGGVLYSWSTGETGVTISHAPVILTVYTVTVTGANGCSASDNASIIVNPFPSVLIADLTICSGTNGTLDAGNPGSTFAWSTSETTQTISVNTAAIYSVTVTSPFNCIASDVAEVFENPVPVADAGSDDTICFGNSGSLTASGGVSYSWSNGSNAQTLNASPATSASYTVTVTGANGCSATDNGAIEVLSLPPADAGANDTICLGEAGTLIASGGVSYSWSSGENTDVASPSPTTLTSYSVTVTGSNGCTASDNAAIEVNPVPLRLLSDVTLCFGSVSILDAENTGSVYAWSTGDISQTISVSSADTYSVTVTNTYACSSSDTSVVTISTNLAVNLSDHVICEGDLLILNAGNPGITHQWSTGDTTQTISVITSGTYTVTVVDGVGCTGEDTSIVTVNPLPTADAGENDTICFGGQGILTASGGIAYLWSSGETSAIINPSPASLTSYSVTVTDGNGCMDSDNAAIEVNPLPVKLLSDLELCFGASGTLDAGNVGSTYSWSIVSSGQIVIVNFAGEYSVTIIDESGCVNSDTAVVSVRPELVVNLTDHQICENDLLILDPENPGIAHLWSTGDTTQLLTVLSGGFYEVTVTDVAGCSGQGSSTVTVNPVPSVDAGADATICAGETTQLTGISAAAFLWSTGESTASISVNPSQTQTYGLTVTDGNNCSNSDSVEVVVNQLPVIDAGVNDTICSGMQGTLTAIGAGTFLWSSGETTASISKTLSTSTTYSVVLTDVNNCSASDAALIFVHGLPVADAGQDVSVCEGQSVILTASGGAQYEWDRGQTIPSFVIIPGSSVVYAVTVTDVNGCQDSDSVAIEVFTLAQVTIAGLNAGYCPNIALVTLSGTPSGGSFSGTALTGNTFSPQSLPAGVFDIIYTYTDLNNCISADTQQVEVFPETSVNFASLSPSYCVSAPKDTLVITPAGGILSGAGITGNIFDPATAGGGVHAISYARTDTFGCFYSDTAYVTVNETALTILGLDTAYCSTASAVAIAGNPAGGTLTVAGVVDSVFRPGQLGVGVHVVSYTYTASGCTNTETVNVRVKICTGVDEIPELPVIKIYPNPSSDELFVDCFSEKPSDLKITLNDISGKVVYASCCQSKFRINVQSFSAGLYFATIQSGRSAVTKKVVVSRN